MNVSRTTKLVAGIICVLLAAQGQRLAWAMTATAQHAPLKTSIGLPINLAYQPDYYVVMDPTGTIGVGLQPYASLGGTFLSLQCNGQGALTFTNNPGAATLSLSASSGTATMNLGLIAGLNVEFLAFGDTISGSLFPDLMPDWGFYDSKSFSSYLLNSPVTLSSTYSHNLVSVNTLDALTIWFGVVIPEWLAGINFNVNADVTLSQSIRGQSVSTSAGSVTSEGQSLSTSVSGSTYQLQNVQETWQDTAALTLGLGADLSADLLWGAISVTLVDFGSVPLITGSQTYELTSAAIPTVEFSLLAQTPTAITLSCGLSPSSATPGAPVSVSGNATYNNGAGGVPSATVTIVVGGATYTAAVNNGQYSRSIYAPPSPGTYSVSATAADGAGRSGSCSSTLTVTSNGGTSGYTINQYLTCQGVNSSSPYDYSGSIDAFGSDDAYFYVWLELLNVYGGHTVEFKLYRPDGSYYNEYSTSIPDPASQGYDYWSWYRPYANWHISGYDIASTEGVWTIKLLIDGNYKRTIGWTMKYNFSQHLMAQDVQTSSPYNPINPRNIFLQSDAKALTWGQALKVSNPLQVQWVFYEPNGSQYATTNFSVPDPDSSGYDYWGWYNFWGWIGIQGNVAASKCGNWRVDVSIQDVTGSWDHVYTDCFSLVEDPPQAPGGSVNAVPAFPTASQTIALNLACSDNTYLQKAVLYWNDGSLHSNVWDNIVASSYSQSTTIGPYGNGTQIQYWAVITDTSGNATETSHQVVAVAPPSGALQVTIAPSGAGGAGAQWRVDGGAWQSSESTVTLSIGSHLVHFSDVPAWNTPQDQTVAISTGQTTTATGTYTAQTGGLTVTINPAGLGSGAQWQVDGGAWHTNGNTVTLGIGGHVVRFGGMPGWNTPQDQSVVVYDGQTTTLSVTYIQLRQLTAPQVSNGVFLAVLNGVVGRNYAIDVSSNLVDWSYLSMYTIPASGWIIVRDPAMIQQRVRFYRAAIQPDDGTVVIPAGTFQMGDTFADGTPFESPVHSVYVSGFAMDQFEVSRELWLDIYNWAVSNGYQFDGPGAFKDVNHPVHSVNWYDAVRWCNARSEKGSLSPCYYTDASQTSIYRTGEIDLSNECVRWSANGYRLPTEAEWEKAARGDVSGRRFPWGDTITHSNANYFSTTNYAYDVSPTRGNHPIYGGDTSPVGSFAPNGYGFYDMAGNVAEWCWDWWGSGWYGSVGASQDDPRGPASSDAGQRVLRSGAAQYDAYGTRCAYHNAYGRLPMYGDPEFGFRTARKL